MSRYLNQGLPSWMASSWGHTRLTLTTETCMTIIISLGSSKRRWHLPSVQSFHVLTDYHTMCIDSEDGQYMFSIYP